MRLQFTHLNGIIALLCGNNMLNYIDRGIISRAPVQFQAFIEEYHSVDRSHVNIYIGFLVSAFIASYSIFICVFGYLSMTRRPFQLIAIGLFIWVLSVVVCGLAKPFQSFDLLLVGRLLSGIGEASFQATTPWAARTPPFIDAFAPPKSRTLYLEVIDEDRSQCLLSPAQKATSQPPEATHAPASHNDESQSNSVVTHVVSILRQPMFLTTTLGVAASCFTLAGMGTFAPAILISYGILGSSRSCLLQVPLLVKIRMAEQSIHGAVYSLEAPLCGLLSLATTSQNVY
ncbi:Aste57867_1418 [Aphanomyces stellatus]|uniref:Aste57867_1418 protein n=2 Tax=Aphanomyces stellatus TaxID=120398 RepID=A0A485K6E7_9STRA|nr:hypothetical protein As57867_001417 [Aphanomyces stellatus]VFT78635.1 Aste57867_1418 [Aphanomyces stellatus]